MAAYNKFQSFVGDMGLGVHNLNTDTCKVMLTNTAPVATNTVLANLTEIAAGNGYIAGGADITNTYSQTGGTATMGATDVVFTAAAGTIGPFRYVVVYNDTAATKPLISWYDYGSSITLQDTETLTVDWTDVFDLT